MTVAAVQKLYVAYFNRPADTLGLNYWVSVVAANGGSTALVSAAFASSAEYAATYAGMSTAARVDAIYNNLFGRSAEPTGLTYWGNLIERGLISVSNAVTQIANGAQGTDLTAYNNKVTAATAFTAALDTTAEIVAYSGTAANAAAKVWLTGITTDATLTTATAATALNASVAGVTTVGSIVVGSTFALTTGVDTPSATAGNDTFNANPGSSNAHTFTALDNIDRGLGTDTLNVTEIDPGAAGARSYVLNAAATVKNVEVLNYTVASDNIGDDVTANVSGFTGLTTVNVAIQGTDAPVTLLTTNGNATSATVTGATTSAITDGATVDKLASVTVVDSTGLATLTSDALTSLTLKASTGGATVTAAAATRGLTVNLDGVSAGTVTDAEATSLTVNASGTKSSGVTLTTAKATAVTLNAAVATTIADVNFAAGKTLTVTGAGAAAITATTGVGVLTSIDASGSAGGLKVGAAIGTGVSFTGGAGADAVILAATTKAIVTGGGNDTVTLNAVAALGTGGSVDAGDGTADTLVFNTFANAVTASGATTFAPTVSNFERLEFSGANAVDDVTINLANLDSINYVTLSATNLNNSVISNMGANGTIVFTADQTTGEGVVLSLANATGTTDVLNMVLSKATATALVSLTAAGIETVNVTSTETATTLLGTVTHGVELLAFADATALNISGNAGVTVTTLTGVKFASIDASGVTAGLVSFTTGALTSAASIKGGAAANTIVATAATKAVTYTGQEKVDTITINNALDNVVNTAGGNDIIVTGSGADTINAGSGNDTITAGAGLNVVTGGAGDDSHGIALQASGNVYTTITDFAVGDSINLGGLDEAADAAGAAISNTTDLGAKITLADTAAFADYLAAATAANSSAAALVKWFQFGGNTFVVVDDEAAASAVFDNGVDTVIRLTGTIDLSKANLTGAVLTLDA